MVRYKIFLCTTLLLMFTATAAFTVSPPSVAVNDTVIYDMGYYTTDGTNWESFSFTGDVHRGAWLIGSATYNAIPDDAIQVAAYSCTWNTGWDCGDDWQTLEIDNASGSDTTVEGLPWSDPATWPDGTVPSQGDDVTITNDMNVTLDVSPPQLASITIEGGTLRFARQDINLTTGMITVHDRGEFRIGTEANPFEHKAVITLTGTRDELPGDGHCGVKGICSFGGKIALHGAVDGPTWTQLDEHANAGDTSITLEEPVSWNVGDEIVITSTSYNPGLAEQRTITAVNDNTVTLNQSLAFKHWGEMQYFGSNDEYPLDERAEVLHLTRNIVVQGDEQSDADNFGGHVMAHNEHHMEQNNRADNGEEYYDLWQAMENDKSLVPEINGVEFNRMGQEGVLARYPFHWHKYGNASGSYVEDSSIHDSYQRCITIHGTQGLRVKNNVAYDVIGHCYFLEDGTEWNNLLKDNVGAVIKRFTDESRELTPSDNRPSIYWWSNPDNDFIGNVAAGAYGFGFWLDPKEHPTGETATDQLTLNDLRQGESPNVQFGTYHNNTVHSTVPVWLQYGPADPSKPGNLPFSGIGFMVFDNNRNNLDHARDIQCALNDRPDDTRCDFTGINAYYNKVGFAAFRSGYSRPVNGTFADNAGGIFTADGNHEQGNILIGNSSNTGNPGTWGMSTHPIDPRWGRKSEPEDINWYEERAGQSIDPQYGLSYRDGGIGEYGINWKYDGAFAADNIFINYHDSNVINRGAQTVPGNSQTNFMLNHTMIDSEPHLPTGPNDNGIVVTDNDGTLTGTGVYTEIREGGPPLLNDSSCVPAPDGEDYRLCSSSTAFIHETGDVPIEDIQTGITDNLNNKWFVTRRTYYLPDPPASLSMQQRNWDDDDWIIFALDGEYGRIDGYKNTNIDQSQIATVTTRDELCSSTTDFTFYHNDGTTYVKLYGASERRTPDVYYTRFPEDGDAQNAFGRRFITIQQDSLPNADDTIGDHVTCPYQPPTLNVPNYPFTSE